MMMQRPLFALLVGINRYASDTVPDLAGCENDVIALRTLLQEHFGAPATAITVLLNEAATRDAIQQAFRERLLAPLQSWAVNHQSAQDTAESPAILFYFSGHGSQSLVPDKATGYDETLVPHDSRVGAVYDIKDRELGLWLAELTKYTTNVTVILDCCHSGSGTRLDKKQLTHIRACPKDDRWPQPPPVSLVPVMRGALTARRQSDHLNYVLFAACRNDEKAREDLLGAPRQRHGLFTYWLLDVLRRQPPHQPITYRTLYDQVRHCLHRGNGANAEEIQTPQCEGDRDRHFLGDLRAARNRWVTVIAEREGLIWVDSGQASGMSMGAILYLYPPAVDTTTPPETPVATLQVDVVEATRSGCVRIDNQPWLPIPLGAPAFIYRYGELRKRIKVALDFMEGMLLNTMRKRMLQPDIYDEIELALPDESAALRLTLINGNTFAIQSGDRQQTYQLYPPGPQGVYRSGNHIHHLELMVRDLHHLVKQMQTGAIASAPGSEIVADLQIAVERLLPATTELLFPTMPMTIVDQVTLLPVDTPFVLWITNGYARALYITVLELGYAGDVKRIYPAIAGANEAVAPGKTLLIGATIDPNAQLIMRLPPAIAQVEERFKVIATTQEANFDHLLQGELPSRQPVMRSGSAQQPNMPTHNAFPRVSEILPEEQWGSLDVRVRVVRAAN